MPIERIDSRWHSTRTVSETEKQFGDLYQSLKPHEREALDLMLKDEKLAKNAIKSAEELDWDPNTGPPVPIRDWVNDDRLIGETGKTLYPVFKQDIIDIFEGNYSEVILCLHPDTRIPLLDGTEQTLKTLSERWKTDPTPFWVYGCKNNKIVPALAVNPRKTGTDDYYRVTLDDGSYYISNSKHKMVMRDGSKKELKDMKIGDSLMPFNVRLSEQPTDEIDGYEMIQQPDTEKYEYTHRQLDHLMEQRLREDQTVRHHKNFNKRDNTPGNLQWLGYIEHLKVHADHSKQWRLDNPERAREIDDILRKNLDIRWNGKDSEMNKAIESERLTQRLHEGFAAESGKLSWVNRSEKSKQAARERIIARNKAVKEIRSDVTLDKIKQLKADGYTTLASVALTLKCSPNRCRKVINDAGLEVRDIFPPVPAGSGKIILGKDASLRVPKIKKAAPSSGISRSITIQDIKRVIVDGAKTQGAAAAALGVSRSTIQNVLNPLGLAWCDVSEYNVNHFVAKIEKIGHGDVYCMTVPDTENFAIATERTTDFDLNNADSKTLLKFKYINRLGVISSNSGSTRIGKNYAAGVIIMRVLYELCCLRDPSRALGLGAGEPIHVVPISHTKKAAKMTIFGKFVSQMNLSPFFRNRFEVTQDEIRFPDKNIYIVGGSSKEGDALGLNAFIVVADELNFLGAGGSDAKSASGETFDKAQQIYNSLARRVKGTYGNSGMSGKMILMSSKKSSTDFTERRIREAIEEKDERVFVRDYAPWHVRPGKFATQRWYKLALSEKGAPPRILIEGEPVPQDCAILPFPEEFIEDFKRDPVGCFTGDTKIPLLDGREVAIQDLVKEKEFYVYSCDASGKFHPGRGHSARLTQKDAPIVEVLLDNGEKIRCTPDHRFMLRDGSYCEAKDLKITDSLMTRVRITTNHPSSVVSVTPCGFADVFDITVDKYNNFSLTSRVYVHNSARDIGGFAIDSASAFLADRQAIDRMMKSTRVHPFNEKTWRTDQELTLKWDQIAMLDAKGNKVMLCCPGAQRHAHLDLSKNRCDTGLVIAHRAADGEVIRRNNEYAKEMVEAPYIHIDAVVRIIPPPGKEVDHEAVRNLLKRIRDEGYPLKSISLDQWMGVPNAQLFEKWGFKVTSDYGVVRKPDAYINLKSLIYEDRIECGLNDDLRRELIDLEFTKDGKVDHPPSGKKDLSDALAGAAFWLIENARATSMSYPLKGGHQSYYGKDEANRYNDNMIFFPEDGGSGGGEAPLWIVT